MFVLFVQKKSISTWFVKLGLQLSWERASQGAQMALYTIGEVALLCDINPVTLRAWQRRYGLFKPQRTDGGHRLFNDADIDRIREIKSWIDNGVQVSKVKTLLSETSSDEQDIWREQQEILLRYLQSGQLHRLRLWLKERGSDFSALFDTLLKVANSPLSSESVAAQVASETRDDTPAAMDAVWEEEQVKFFADQGCGESEISAHQRRFAGAVAPQYLNISNGGQQ